MMVSSKGQAAHKLDSFCNLNNVSDSHEAGQVTMESTSMCKLVTIEMSGYLLKLADYLSLKELRSPFVI